MQVKTQKRKVLELAGEIELGELATAEVRTELEAAKETILELQSRDSPRATGRKGGKGKAQRGAASLGRAPGALKGGLAFGGEPDAADDDGEDGPAMEASAEDALVRAHACRWLGLVAVATHAAVFRVALLCVGCFFSGRTDRPCTSHAACALCAAVFCTAAAEQDEEPSEEAGPEAAIEGGEEAEEDAEEDDDEEQEAANDTSLSGTTTAAKSAARKAKAAAGTTAKGRKAATTKPAAVAKSKAAVVPKGSASVSANAKAPGAKPAVSRAAPGKKKAPLPAPERNETVQEAMEGGVKVVTKTVEVIKYVEVPVEVEVEVVVEKIVEKIVHVPAPAPAPAPVEAAPAAKAAEAPPAPAPAKAPPAGVPGGKRPPDAGALQRKVQKLEMDLKLANEKMKKLEKVRCRVLVHPHHDLCCRTCSTPCPHGRGTQVCLLLWHMRASNCRRTPLEGCLAQRWASIDGPYCQGIEPQNHTVSLRPSFRHVKPWRCCLAWMQLFLMGARTEGRELRRTGLPKTIRSDELCIHSFVVITSVVTIHQAKALQRGLRAVQDNGEMMEAMQQVMATMDEGQPEQGEGGISPAAGPHDDCHAAHCPGTHGLAAGDDEPGQEPGSGQAAAASDGRGALRFPACPVTQQLRFYSSCCILHCSAQVALENCWFLEKAAVQKCRLTFCEEIPVLSCPRTRGGLAVGFVEETALVKLRSLVWGHTSSDNRGEVCRRPVPQVRQAARPAALLAAAGLAAEEPRRRLDQATRRQERHPSQCQEQVARRPGRGVARCCASAGAWWHSGWGG